MAGTDEIKFHERINMDYYTKQEIAGLFGVSLNTIASWLKKGKIKKIEPYDRPMRFNKEYIDKMIDGETL